MINIAFLDDDNNQLEIYKEFLKEYQLVHNIDFNVTFFNDGYDLLEADISNYSAIFLDIDMPLINGIEVAEKIRLKDENVDLIFVTMLANYAIKGYKVKALDYILKPVSKYEFNLILDKIIKKEKYIEKVFIIHSKSITRKVNYKDISYFEMFNHNVYVHGENLNLNFRGTLKEIEKQIDFKQFVRCNSSIIVNLFYVEEIKNNFLYLKTGEKIEITKARKKEVLDKLITYVGK